MNKVISITAIILSSVLVLVSLPMLFFRIFTPMPEQMKDKTVCFLAPDLTWSDKMSAVTKSFGTPVERGVYDDLTGTISNTYVTEYKNHKMEVRAERQTFPNTTNVFDYGFYIQCEDAEDAQKIFDECYNQILEDNADDEYFSYEIIDNEDGVEAILVDSNGQIDEIGGDQVWFSIDYGATGIHYELSQTYDYRVILWAYCMY